MSELQTRFIDETYCEYYKTGKHDFAQVYLKSEADNVIAKKDKKIDLYKRGFEEIDKINAYLFAEARHHKYKRCLAMAEWCNSGMVVETFACFRPRSTKEVWREEHKYWAKWRKIWFKLAEKFKPNSTAQQGKG